MKMKIRNESNPYVVIVGLDTVQGLQAARIFSENDIPVIGVGKDRRHFSFRTNSCRHKITADTHSPSLIDSLIEIGQKLTNRAVLIPCEDVIVLLISRNRERLKAWFRIVLPEEDVVETLMNKDRFYQYAQRIGAPIPQTYFLTNRTTAEVAAEKLNYPGIVKPSFKSREWIQLTALKAFKVYNPDQLLAVYDQYSQISDSLIVQDYIEGPSTNLFSCIVYFDNTSNPAVTFTARKLRQWPPETGQTCLGEALENETITRNTIRLFRELAFYGLGYLEVKKDDRNGKYYIIEPNIGRPTGPSALAEACQVDRLYRLYCDAVGKPFQGNLRPAAKGLKWVYLRQDFQSFLHHRRSSRLSVREWLASLKGPKAYAVFSWKDPRPFFSDILRVIRIAMTPSERQKRNFRNMPLTQTEEVKEIE